MSHQALDPDAPSISGQLFGLDIPVEEALVQLIPVPWEVTASYGRGTRHGPEAVLAASGQIDLEDLDYGDAWRAGIGLLEADPRIAAWGTEVEADALDAIEAGGADEARAARVDARSAGLNEAVYLRAVEILDEGRIPGVLGGDHSSPLGLIRALSERFPGLGILHIDAHADLRDGSLGFRWAHASIMHHALALPGVGRLVGVGYRDLGQAELSRIHAEADRIEAFFDAGIQRELLSGGRFDQIVGRILAALPERVYLSVDIDGLDPALCPNTGTPVPGGLSWGQITELLRQVAVHKEILGFDLCEVSPGPDGVVPSARLRASRSEWDANVGARLLFKLASAAIRARERRGRAGGVLA